MFNSVSVPLSCDGRVWQKFGYNQRNSEAIKETVFVVFGCYFFLFALRRRLNIKETVIMPFISFFPSAFNATGKKYATPPYSKFNMV